MNRKIIILSAFVVICLSAYFFGRAYENSKLTLVSSVPSVSTTPVATSVNPPADFGNVVYHDLATISFADLYETLRDAPPSMRAEWLGEIEQTPESPRKISALCGFFRALVQTDPRIAGELVIQLPRHRGPAIDAMISAAPPSAMPDLAEMLLKVPTEAREYQLTDHLGMVIDDWAQVDPEAAARFLEQHKELSLQHYGDSLVKTWAGIDAGAAWKWLEAHSENIQPFAVDSWLSGWFTSDAQAAINFALAHANDEKFSGGITNLAPELFQQNQTSAKKFIDQLPTSEMRQAALQGVVFLGSSPDSPDDCSAPTVANFIIQFPSAEWPERFSEVIERWRFTAATELLDWISRLAPELQAKVIENFPAASSFGPEQDFLPVLQVSDSSLRAQLLRQLVRDRDSGTQWTHEAVAELRLSPEQKAEIEAFIQEDKKE